MALCGYSVARSIAFRRGGVARSRNFFACRFDLAFITVTATGPVTGSAVTVNRREFTLSTTRRGVCATGTTGGTVGPVGVAGCETGTEGCSAGASEGKSGCGKPRPSAAAETGAATEADRTTVAVITNFLYIPTVHKQGPTV